MVKQFGLALLILVGITSHGLTQEKLKVGTFAVDASPRVGSPLAYDPCKGIQMPLSCRGLVIMGKDEPIVLCAVDWIGIGNDSLKIFRESLAQAAGTSPERVTVHTLHQHDAPISDFSVDAMLAKYKQNHLHFDVAFERDVIARTAKAAKNAIANAQQVTHVGMGEGKIEKVASNRRILGPDGKVKYVRYTATKDPKIRAFPTGVIDPNCKLISFWNGDSAVAVLTYYATHPQSYYRTGMANPDFPGMARNQRDKATGVMHVHFNGAGGNIGAGKWNDGAVENRQILADRVAKGMALAWQKAKDNKHPVVATEIGWKSMKVHLPAGNHLNEKDLQQVVADDEAKELDRFAAARNLIWLRRCMAKDGIDVSCLQIGKARILHMPGELFVEYQLAAQKMRPDMFVAIAAYGDYAPGYIGTAIGYTQGGYETSQRASRVGPGSETVLMNAIRQLLEVK